MLNYFKFILTIFICLSCPMPTLAAGTPINSETIPMETDILFALRDSLSGLEDVYNLRDAGKIVEASINLARYFKTNLGKRYYFNWKQFPDRLNDYKYQYPEAMAGHHSLSHYQKTTFGAKTSWKLPFRDLKDKEVTAYELRHLARQQKSADMALMYFTDNDEENLEYFVTQVADLNRAFTESAYDDAGNGIYEVFRAGKRVQNWMFCHNVYLSSAEYSDENQMLLIRTLMHHGAQLAKRGKKVNYGNHHTRGLVALFEIAVMFPEFKISEKWREQALEGLIWHLKNEVNPDGFQFERSVHYHKGDIENYFRVYQLALINQISLPNIYIVQFRKLFESLVRLAQPNLKLPVLQDDTDAPFTEFNEMADALTLGTITFRDSGLKYFAADTIPSSVYWLISDDQLSVLPRIASKKPDIMSTELAQTGYFVMRNGWDNTSLYATITAGLSAHKPDHQHGDMLGMVAFANGHEILPNYQVRYKDEDYSFWKNSWVKNVALLDSIPQARGWQPNSGGSGFGKWRFLPEPHVVSWIKTEKFDHFIGSHNAYDSLDANYIREILFIKDGFWLIVDRFRGKSGHIAQQVWQGYFDILSARHIKKTYADGTGLEIVQFNDLDYRIERGSFRDKFNTVFSVSFEPSVDLYTIINPFSTQDSSAVISGQKFAGWQINSKIVNGIGTDAHLSLANTDQQFLWLIDCTSLTWKGKHLRFDIPVSLFIDDRGKMLEITVFTHRNANITAVPELIDFAGSLSSGSKLKLLE